jgi:hypothetical protein
LTPVARLRRPTGENAAIFPKPDLFQVKRWMIHTTLNSRDNRRGIDQVVPIGRAMSAFWPDETNERGVPNCYALVTYGDGKCVIDVSRFPPGKFVPVTVSFNYGGKIYTAQTGFTPQAP